MSGLAGWHSEGTVLWASAAESDERWWRETLPVDVLGPYFHPGGCGNCGDGPCYRICPNHPDYYSAEREREDSMANDAMSRDEWLAAAADEYERAHGEPYVS